MSAGSRCSPIRKERCSRCFSTCPESRNSNSQGAQEHCRIGRSGPSPPGGPPCHSEDAVFVDNYVMPRRKKEPHQLEGCPACGETMRLVWDRYTCESCGHFAQNPDL